MNSTNQALINLMPKGGWSFDGENVTVHAEGESHGYTVPTNEELTAEVARVEANESALEELAQLDKYISRAMEDIIIERGKDTFLIEKATRKKELREGLL